MSMEKNVLYVLIDDTLDPIYGAVQGGHAVAEWLLHEYEMKFNKFCNEDEPKWKWNNDYLVYLQVDIHKWISLLRNEHCTTYEEFYEEDLDGKLTSIAVHEDGMNEYLKHIIKKEKLLSI